MTKRGLRIWKILGMSWVIVVMLLIGAAVYCGKPSAEDVWLISCISGFFILTYPIITNPK